MYIVQCTCIYLYWLISLYLYSIRHKQIKCACNKIELRRILTTAKKSQDNKVTRKYKFLNFNTFLSVARGFNTHLNLNLAFVILDAYLCTCSCCNKSITLFNSLLQCLKVITKCSAILCIPRRFSTYPYLL